MILNEMGNVVSYVPHPDMKRILLQEKEHPLPPQETIVLLHRSKTVPLHYDATQPTTRIPRSSSIVPPHQFPNPLDPAQRFTWLREHQLPNQKPSKLILTNLQDLTRRQITNLKKIKRPKSFHAQSSKDQINLQQIETDLEPPLPTLIATSTKTPQPNLPFPEKRNDQDQLENPNETKKQKLKDFPPPTMTHHLHLSSMVQLPLIHHKQKIILMNNPKQINGNKLIQQYYSNEDSQETEKQRLSHGPNHKQHLNSYQHIPSFP
jgi:hypothetical protein